VANGGDECCRGCGGRYPVTTEDLTRVFLSGRLNAQNLCPAMAGRVEIAARKAARVFEHPEFAALGQQYITAAENTRAR